MLQEDMVDPQRKRKRQPSEIEDARSSPRPDASSESLSKDHGSTRSAKKARVGDGRSLFVRSLPPGTTNESLADFFSQHFPVKHAVVVLDPKTKDSRGYGFVTLADADDALEAQKALDKAEWSGKRIRIDVAEPRHRSTTDGVEQGVSSKHRKDEAQKPPKLIVRNLPWSIKTSEQLSHLFRSFGKVKYADLPSANGTLKGFGFVTIRGRKNAEKALEAVNGKEIDGRTLAVDWAVEKDVWEKSQQQTVDESEKPIEQDAPSSELIEGGEPDAAAPAASASSTAAKSNMDPGLDADLKNFLDNHMGNLEDESENEKDDGDDDKPGPENPQNQRPKRMTDNSSTVFIRNLPFTTTDAQLKEFFSYFGRVRYARVVIDKITDKPAGTAFVCFAKESDSKACLKDAPRPKMAPTNGKKSLLMDENADPGGHFTLDGRLLQVSQAVNKEQAMQLADHSQAERRLKDKRRLFLLSEGAVGPNSPLAKVLTPTELQMRQASAAQRRKLVQKNPSLHLSLTRLALRNIPRNIGSKELKELARKAVVNFATEVKQGLRQPLSKEENSREGKDAKEKERLRKMKRKGIIRQAKVIFESNEGSKVPEQSGSGKSRGYGFVEYSSHRWALMGLRYLNGLQLPGEQGKKQRLVVEFSIENAQVVQRRRAAEEKSAQSSRLPSAAASESSEADDEDKDDNDQESVDDAAADRASRRQKGVKRDKEGMTKDEARRAERKEELQQKLVGRKRLIRKKKAKMRGIQ